MVMRIGTGALLALLSLVSSSGADQRLPDATSQARSWFAPINGTRLHLLDWGGEGSPVIFLPGGCDTPYVFDDIASRLSKQFHVYGLTSRGCATSGQADDGYSLDLQIDDVIGLLDGLDIERASFVGHSSGAGKLVRLARRFPNRVQRLVLLDPIYSGVPAEFERRFQATVDRRLGATKAVSLARHRGEFSAWELGVWSSALARDFELQTRNGIDGRLIYRPRPLGWHDAFVDDVRNGRYFETRTTHPALLFEAQDLDLARVRGLSASEQRSLLPLAEASAKARREQIAGYQRDGNDLSVVSMRNVSHYLFIDRAQEVAAGVRDFLLDLRVK